MARGRRSRIDGAASTERIWAWLTPGEREALKAMSLEEGKPVAVLIREAVNSYVGDFTDRKIFPVTGNSATPVS